MFIDYLTLLLANMTAGLAVFAWFLLCGIHKEDTKAWAPAFAVPGLIAFLFGTVMVVTWPLPGPFNIIYGEMSVLFGAVFLAAAWALARGWSLSPLSILTFLAGLWAILMGHQILTWKILPKDNPTVALGFIVTGAGGLLLGVVLCMKKKPLARWAAAAVVLAAAVFWASVTCGAYRGHLNKDHSDFYHYKPALMREAPAIHPATQPAPTAATTTPGRSGH